MRLRSFRVHALGGKTRTDSFAQGYALDPMLRRGIRWWSLPIGRVPWSWVAALAFIEAAALWAIYAATSSFYLQAAVLLAGTVLWLALRHRAARNRPLPPKSDLPPMTINRFMEFIALEGFFGAVFLVLFLFGEDALGIEAGQGFWFYVALLLPNMALWNTAGANRRYGGSIARVAPSSR